MVKGYVTYQKQNTIGARAVLTCDELSANQRGSRREELRWISTGTEERTEILPVKENDVD